MSHRVVVIGAGATGTAALWALDRHRVGDEIRVVDPLEPGHGRVFDTGDAGLLCNTSVGVMSLRRDDRDDFRSYLRARGHDVAGGDFVSRDRFGRYCRARHRQATASLRARGADVAAVRGRAVGVRHGPDGDYRVRLADGRSLAADDVLVCSGVGAPVLPDVLRPHADAPGLFRSPYPTRDLRAGLAPGSRVLVLGTRLSAVDATTALCESGHRATMASRSGVLPAVRTSIRHSGLAPVDESAFADLDPQDPDLARAVLRLVRRATGVRSALPLSAQTCRDADAVERLRRETALAESGATLWQESVAELIDLTNDMLGTVDAPGRERAMRTCAELLTRYVSAMPLTNARRLLAALDAGTARIAGAAPAELTPDGGGWSATWPGAGRERFDAVVCATGFADPELSCTADGLELGSGGSEPDLDTGLRVRLPGRSQPERIRLLGAASYRRVPIVNYLRTAADQADLVVRDMSTTGRLRFDRAVA